MEVECKTSVVLLDDGACTLLDGLGTNSLWLERKRLVSNHETYHVMIVEAELSLDDKNFVNPNAGSFFQFLHSRFSESSGFVLKVVRLNLVAPSSHVHFLSVAYVHHSLKMLLHIRLLCRFNSFSLNPTITTACVYQYVLSSSSFEHFSVFH